MKRKSGTVAGLVDQLEFNWFDFDVESFARFIAHRQQRSIHVVPYAFDASITAVCVRGQESDYIFFRQSAYPLLQVHGILHELGHLLLGHQGVVIDEMQIPDVLQRLAAEKVTVTHSQDEYDAESFAQLITLRIRQAKRIHREGQRTSIPALRPFAESGL